MVKKKLFWFGLFLLVLVACVSSDSGYALVLSDGVSSSTDGGSLLVCRDPFFGVAFSIRGFRHPMGLIVLQEFDGVSSSTDGGSLRVLRDPFFSGVDTRVAVCGGLGVEVLAPANGSVFYFPSVSPNFTFYVSGFYPTCYYRVDGHAWNNVSCVLGNNSKVITLPWGQPVTVEFNVSKWGCSAVDSVQLMVYYPQNSGFSHLKGLVMIGFVFLLIALDRRRLTARRRRRRRQF